MKLKMIGTGAWSVKDRSSCSLIDDRILIDCGNGILKNLLAQNVDISKIDTLLITHLHGDHFLDIPFLIMQRNFISAENELNIYGPEGTENTIAKLISLAYATYGTKESEIENLMKYSKLQNARDFCKDVKELSKKYNLPFFVVIDGASATSNNGCEAVKNGN